MSNAAKNEVLSSFRETINRGGVAAVVRSSTIGPLNGPEKAKTPFHPIFQLLSLAMVPRLKSAPVFLSNP